jgi:hypothetical protein
VHVRLIADVADLVTQAIESEQPVRAAQAA